MSQVDNSRAGVVKDLRLELRARNNVLWHAIFDVSPSVAEFCTTHPTLDQGIVGQYLNLQLSPYFQGRRGRQRAGKVFKDSAEHLAAVLGIDPETLFPRALYEQVAQPRVVLEMDATRLVSLLAAAKQPALTQGPEERAVANELRRELVRQLDTLTPREAQVIRRRYGLDDGEEATFEEISQEIGVGRQRTFQIHAKALRKLRHKSRSARLAGHV